jgi:RHS repeat-associated protein
MQQKLPVRPKLALIGRRRRRRVFVLPLILVGLVLLRPRVAEAPDPPLTALAPFEVFVENVRSPRYLAVDQQNRLLVSEAHLGQVLQIAPDRTVSVLIDRVKDPEGLVVDPTGAVFAAADRQQGPEGQEQHGMILRRDPQTGALAVVANDFKSPRGLAWETGGILLLATQGRRHERDERGIVYAISTAGQILPVADAFKQPQGVLAAPDGSVLVAAEQFERGRERLDGSLFRVDPTGQVSAFLTRRLKDPFGLARDPVGGVYLTGTQTGTSGPDLGVILKRRPDDQEVVFAQGLDTPRGLAVDQQGHLYVAEAGRRRFVKFTAPAMPTLDSPPPTVTNQAMLALTGTAEPGALLTGMGEASMTTTFADGAGRFSLAAPLTRNASNALTVYATARGGDGLTSAPTPLTVIHDDQTPTVAFTGPAAGALLRGSVTVTATARDANGLSLLTLRRDTTIVAVGNTSPLTTSLDTTLLADGPHGLSVTARDRAGNEASAAVGITTDNTPPVLAITAPAHGSAVATRTPGLAVSYSDATAGVALSTFRATLDGADISGLFAATSTGATATVPSPLAEGPHALTVTIADRADNVASANATFTVSTSPDFALTADPTVGTAIQGMETSFSVTVVPFNNYANLVSLAVTGLPTGVRTRLTPPQVAPNATARLAVTAPGTLAAGTYPFTVTGTGLVNGVLASRSVTASLAVLPAGATALSGRVVTTEEAPLANVTIRLGTLTTLTDGGGNFLLSNPPAGEQVVLIDGSTASTPNASYPTIPVTVTIQPGQVTSLGFTPHLHAQPVARTVPLTPGQAATVTDPAIPGFTVQIPAGVTITGWDGQPNTQLGMRVVPPDRSPLPPLELPAGYGAGPLYMFYFGKVGGGTPTAPVPVIGPNDLGGLPGEKVDLYFYDEAPDGSRPNQWAKYGTGTVSPDGTTILPDLDPATGKPYGMPRFCCGAWRPVYPPPPPPANPNLAAPGTSPGGTKGGEPVDLATGFFTLEKTDLVLPGRLPLVLTRTYRSGDTQVGSFGIGGRHTYDAFLVFPTTGATEQVILVMPDLTRYAFARRADGSFQNATDPGMQGAVVTLSGSNRILRFKDGAVWTFDGNGRLVTQQDRNGNTVMITRDGQGRVTALTEPAGRQFTFSYSGTGLQISQVSDPIGRMLRYTYDGSGRLASVTDPLGGVTSYTYDANHQLLTITDPRGITFLRNEYDSAGRVSRQIQADGGVWSFAYTLTSGVITETRLTDPRGHGTTYRFNTRGYLVAQTDALGQTGSFERAVGTNLLLSTTDTLGRTVHFSYDAGGNVTAITDPQGNVRTFTYEPSFNRLTSITDPLGQVTRFEYDGVGNLTAVIDPLQQRTTITYNAVGQPTRTTDPLGNATQFAYDASGNLTTISDPLGNASTRTYDVVSRLLTQTDPRGKTTTFAYDALNRLTQLVDPLGGVTRFTHDGNGNLLTVTDALTHTLTHEYDSMDRLSRRLDPVGAAETYSYDGNGNLVSTTDRKGQTTTFTYDPLNRRIRATYADGSLTTFAYDAAGRLVQADDAADPHRPIALAYDTLDRLVAETTGMGTVAYAYDVLGRRTQMRVNDLNPVTYTYDAASQLRTITQAPLNPVTIDYDAVGRRTRLTLPNAVSTEYQYDAASRLTTLIYRNATGVLGDLTYTYDRAGNRTGVGGSFARTLLPDVVPSASYDAANRQRAFGDKTLAYDTNGNLTSITDSGGVTTFTWDARNRLIGLNAPSTMGTFSYDPLGRRGSKQISGQLTQYFYDGVDIAQQVDPLGTTSYLRSLNVDEAFSFTNRNGTYFSVSDPLGSTLAITDSAATPVVQYTYDPFGRTASTNLVFANPFQYTNRENDSLAGLYSYRARYYSPTLQRFTSEDPLHSPLRKMTGSSCQGNSAPNLSWYLDVDPGIALLMMFRFNGFANSLAVNPQQLHLYTYVYDNPINKNDPMGLLAAPQTAGCDPGDWGFNRCATKCCNEHDDCYKRAYLSWCDQSTWLEQFFPYGKYGNRTRVECQECNSAVVRCLARATWHWGSRRKDPC